jgi:hypothetical protein
VELAGSFSSAAWKAVGITGFFSSGAGGKAGVSGVSFRIDRPHLLQNLAFSGNGLPQVGQFMGRSPFRSIR